MASAWPGGIDSVPDIVNPTVTDCNVAPTLSTRLNLATDAVTAIETWLQANVSSWVPPSGMIAQFAGSTAPAGWLLCQGQAVSRTTYPNLFTAIGTAFGSGDGSTTFNVPSMANRVAVGVGATALGGNVGSNLIALSTANLPAHNHGITDPTHYHGINDYGHNHGINDPGHNHSFPDAISATAATGINVFAVAASQPIRGTSVNQTSITVQQATTGITVGVSGTGVSTQNTGSGATFSIQPASLALNFIIKT